MPGPNDVIGAEEPWNSIFQIWIKFATIQGQVYERLYSPAALSQPENERAEHARQLAAQVMETIDAPFDVCVVPPSAGQSRRLIHHSTS